MSNNGFQAYFLYFCIILHNLILNMLIFAAYLFLSPVKIKRQGNQPFFPVYESTFLNQYQIKPPAIQIIIAWTKSSKGASILQSLLPSLREDDSFKILLAAQWIFNERSSCDTCFFCRALRLTLKAGRKMVLWACKGNDFHLRRYTLKLS